MHRPLGFSCPSLHWLVWKLRSQERLHVFFKTFLSLCQLLRKHQARSLERWGRAEGGFLIIQCFVRNTDSVLSVIPRRSTNSSASKWQFRWRLLFYRGDKLQVSLVALGGSFRAARQLAEWEPGLWLTAAPDRAQSPRSAAVASSRSTRPMTMSVRSLCPTHSAFSSNDDDSVESMSNQPFFFPPVSLLNEMMNDVVSPSRMATHTNLLPGIYTFAGSYVGHFSLILCCCLSAVFLSVCICLKWRLMSRGVPSVDYICFSCALETAQLVTLEFDNWDKLLIFWRLIYNLKNLTLISRADKIHKCDGKKLRSWH